MNIPRQLFRWQLLEQWLSGGIHTNSHFLKKLVPPEYLYPKGTWRTSQRNGLRMRLDISNVVDHEIYFNLYDRSFEKYLNGLGPVSTFWDIGANIGWTALQVNHKFTSCKIVAFEPSPKNRKRLKENLDLNHANVEIVPYGLGHEANTFKLYSVLENNPGMNRIIQEEKDLPFETIEVITAASFWEKSGRPKVDALKIDVEGFEMFVLQGMEEMVSDCKPAMFLEVDHEILSSNGSSAKQLLTWLSQHHYSIQDAQTGYQLKDPFENLLPHFDIIAK